MKEEKMISILVFILNLLRLEQTRTHARIRLVYNTSLCGYRFIFNKKKYSYKHIRNEYKLQQTVSGYNNTIVISVLGNKMS